MYKQLNPRVDKPTITLEHNTTLKNTLRLHPSRRIQLRMVKKIAVSRIKGSLKNKPRFIT